MQLQVVGVTRIFVQCTIAGLPVSGKLGVTTHVKCGVSSGESCGCLRAAEPPGQGSPCTGNSATARPVPRFGVYMLDGM